MVLCIYLRCDISTPAFLLILKWLMQFLQFLSDNACVPSILHFLKISIYLYVEDCKNQINRIWENLGYNYGFSKCITLALTLAKAKKIFVSYKEFATYTDTLAHQERKYFLNVYNQERGLRSTRSTEFATSQMLTMWWPL